MNTQIIDFGNDEEKYKRINNILINIMIHTIEITIKKQNKKT
jgi:hypothetical protein